MRFSIRETVFSNKPVANPLIFVLTIEAKKHRLFALQMIEKENHDVGTLQIIRIQGGPIFPFVNDRSFGGVVFALCRHVIASAPGSSAVCQGVNAFLQHHVMTPAITFVHSNDDMFDRVRPGAALETQISSRRRLFDQMARAD